MPRLPFRIAMFLSSFSPLFALMAYENRSIQVALVILSAASAIGIGGLATVMRQLASEKGPQIEVRDSAPKDGEVLSYIAVYLVPFLGIDLGKTNDVVIFCGFLAILGLVYINSNMLFVNPILSLVGFHSFEVIDANAHTYTLIVRSRSLNGGSIIRPAHVDRYLRVEAHWRPMAPDDPPGNP